MPDRDGFNHLTGRGELTLRCMWCHVDMTQESDAARARHGRSHAKEQEAAAAAAAKERRQVATVVKQGGEDE